MSGYDNFADRFLAALYLETEESGRDFQSVRSIEQKYGISPEKAHWISRMADEWEYVYFKDVSKVLGGYDGWSFRISPDGFRKVEAEFRDADEIREFLKASSNEGPERSGASIQDFAEAERIPASDRIVRIDHNSESYRVAVQKTGDLLSALERGNDVGNLTAEGVAVAAAEVGSLGQELRGEAVRMPAFFERAKSVLGWIGKESAGAVVGALAAAAFVAIAAYFGIVVPA